jgi:hypothetical protein
MRVFLTTALLLVLPIAARAVQMNTSVVAATCGACNGSIVASATGGSGGYTYLWAPEPTVGQGTGQASGLCPGTYTVTVWDTNGDSATATVDVSALPGLDVGAALASSSIMASCAGQCTGQLFLNETLLGGQPPYTTTTWPAMPLNGICGGTLFDLTVTDVNGCSGSITTTVPEHPVPHLLYSEVLGPCGGTPTAVVAHFDVLPMGATLATPFGTVAPVTVINGGLAIVGGIPGVYILTHQAFPPCPTNSWAIMYPGTVTDCATVSGDVFTDVNTDCANNAGDFGLAHRVVDIAPGFATLTNTTGHFQCQLPDGTYDLSVDHPMYTQDCPVASPMNFTVDQTTPATIDIAFTPGPDPDLSVSCAFGQAVVGFQQDVWITVTNSGGVESGPLTVTLDHDPLLSYCMIWYCIAPPVSPPIVLPYPTSSASGQLIWDLPAGLPPGATRMLSARLCVPADVTLLGHALSYTVNASTMLNDADPSDNTCTHATAIIGSYDPNDKLALTTSGSSSEWSLENDSLITYTIRFQNTGTAPAVNVVLVDTLQPTLDLSSLRILGASHVFSATLNDRVLSFTFDHIMLPDSGANEAGSHGFAQFSIRPTAMSPGSSVENFADIYFDFNPPIRTNTSVVTAPLITGLAIEGAPTLKLMPNPGREHLILELPHGVHTITIFDATGRMVQRHHTTDARPVIATDALPAGVYRVHVRDAHARVTSATWVKES